LSFAEIFGTKKIEYLGYRGVVCIILPLAVSVEHRVVTDGREMDRQTHDDIYTVSKKRVPMPP